MKIYQGDVWGIETAGWSIEPDDVCLTLCPADVEAGLHISAYQKRSAPVTRLELLQAIRERAPSEAHVEEVVCGAFAGFCHEYTSETEALFWRVWHLARGRTELFITYNTSPQYADRHREVVDWILSTLTVGRAS